MVAEAAPWTKRNLAANLKSSPDEEALGVGPGAALNDEESGK